MPSDRAFDFTAAMRRLCVDVTERLPEFRHVRMEEVAVTFAQARRRVMHGLQAKLTPLRFEGGALTTNHRGRVYTIQRWYADEREMLYVLTFYLPRFLEQTYREKLITVLHELYHISPQFDGDIRRLAGHYHVHSSSQKEYDRHMARMVDRYLSLKPPSSLHEFLRGSYSDLVAQHGRVVGVRMPIPKLLPLSKSA
jgi:predicted metallopeptidase